MESDWFGDIHFVDSNTGWAIRRYGSIWKTTDGGNLWFLQKETEAQELYACYFTDKNTGYAAGYPGIILKTTDGGNTWNKQVSGITTLIKRIKFPDPETGYAASSYDNGSAIILKTTNAGVTWTSKSLAAGDVNDIHFIDSETGWAIGSNGTVYNTTNGGSSWQLQYSDMYNALWAVFFSDKHNGWVSGYGGNLLHTSNGGSTWEVQRSGTSGQLNSLYFIDQYTGWAAGTYVILKTTNGGVTFAAEDKGSEIPEQYFLSQNYPNPFNPSTKINYSLPEGSNVQIKIYDVIGNEIKILVDGYESAGSHDVNFDAGNLSSGVYFYRIQAEKFTITKKMVLVR